MLDVEIFKAVINQKNIEFLVNGKKGFVEIKLENIIFLDEEKEIVESLDYKQLENVKTIKGSPEIKISDSCVLEVREVAPVYF